MKWIDATRTRGPFDVVAGTPRSMGAVMTLAPGASTGGDRHEESDQWLYVVSGRGTATVEGTVVDLEPGILLLIEAGEVHDVAAGEDAPLVTVTLYAPPAH